jgi:hypothetical protein
LVPTEAISEYHFVDHQQKYLGIKKKSSYPIGIAGEEPIHVIRELAILVEPPGYVEEVFCDTRSVFSVRDPDRAILTMERSISIKHLSLKTL